MAHRQIPRGCPQAKGKIERSYRTDEGALAAKLRQWEAEYNHRRLHLARRGRTPAERLWELRIASDTVSALSLSITA